MSKEKEILIEYLKGFSDITVRKICKELGFSNSNVSSGKASLDVYRKVSQELSRRVKENESKTSTL